ncbi:hypothetical protein MTR67_045006 [Solanum verrucosum]|uniref:RNase H type-1 domain-containing protein n=1 Tax=Solanum verrucosum TaxID=315347 RepID=A0AAF0UUI4_SOLVR|nr:hypothetical protein MTR67_045006 [Solanum verrucosum]
MGLNMAIDLDVLIRQAQGEWKTRDLKLLPYKQCVEDLSKRFRSIEFRYIPRFHNELADVLATLVSMLPYPGNICITSLEIQLRDQRGYCNTVEAESDGEPWYLDIMNFLQTGKCPEHANGSQKRTIRCLASGFFFSGEILYKRTPDLNLLRCVDVKEAEKIMNEVHAGVCRSTVRTSIGATPYLLVYRTEAVIPAEVEIPSLRIIVEAEFEDTKWVKTRLEQLTLIDEKRLTAVCFGQLYQQMMARAYNKKVHPGHFEVGQLVLKRILPHQEEAKGKFAPNWQGPYLIKEVLSK